uniref:Uncharacterized protein n=1 Tax=Panagrolaimus sp. PS1159 TaxID=55785 RepID=A0AC35GKP0_9BILA
MTNITECFKNHQCLIPSQYNVFDKIINTCSDEAFRMLNLPFHPSKPPITTYIDDLQNLATKKIGPILDSYTTNFPPGVTDTLANMTYEELDALKIIAAAVPYLKQFLCDSEEDQRVLKISNPL